MRLPNHAVAPHLEHFAEAPRRGRAFARQHERRALACGPPRGRSASRCRSGGLLLSSSSTRNRAPVVRDCATAHYPCRGSRAWSRPRPRAPHVVASVRARQQREARPRVERRFPVDSPGRRLFGAIEEAAFMYSCACRAWHVALAARPDRRRCSRCSCTLTRALELACGGEQVCRARNAIDVSGILLNGFDERIDRLVVLIVEQQSGPL